jgi:hypothetical protein
MRKQIEYARDALYEAAWETRQTRVEIPLTSSQRARLAVAVHQLIAIAGELESELNRLDQGDES